MPKITSIIDVVDTEHPIPARRFVQSLHGTHDEVWTIWIMQKHGRENHLLDDWHALLDSYRHQPAL